jgi:hypothetical protein
MDQARSRHVRRYSLIAILLTSGIAIAATMAQTKPAGPPSAAANYEFVGVGGSLVRIDKESERVEILEQRNSPGMNLTLEQGRPWTWREIRVDNRPGRPSDHESRGSGPKDGD